MTFRKILSGVTGITLALLSTATFAASVAVFGDNNTDNFLNGNGHTATLVSDAELATPGFLDAFDLFIYTRNGSSLNTNLSEAAAANVAAFVEGNVVLFPSDLQDNNYANEAGTLMLNAVGYADQKGFIGEWGGSCAAVTSNSAGFTPLGLIEGACAEVSCGQAGDPITVLQAAHPVVAGVPGQFSLGGANQCFAIVSADSSLVIAESAGDPPVPSIIAGEGMEGGEDRATFEVTKTFSNGATGDVEVTLTCNGGLPLQQRFTISGGDPAGVTFTVTNLPDAGVDCEVTESGGNDGYMADLSACAWTGVTGGSYSCPIENIPESTAVTIETMVDNDDPTIDDSFVTTISCDSVNPTTDDNFTQVTVTDGSGLFEADWYADPDGGTTCQVSTVFADSAIQGAPCEFSFDVGDSATGCDVSGMVFFEGIPTLSQYGMAILALLMLGVGFIGFRRIV